MHTKQYLYVATAKIYPQIKLGNGCKTSNQKQVLIFDFLYKRLPDSLDRIPQNINCVIAQGQILRIYCLTKDCILYIRHCR